MGGPFVSGGAPTLPLCVVVGRSAGSTGVVVVVVVSVSVKGSSKVAVVLDDELEVKELEEEDDEDEEPVRVPVPNGFWVDQTVDTVSVMGTPSALVPVDTTMVFPSSYGSVMVTCASAVLEKRSDASAAASA